MFSNRTRNELVITVNFNQFLIAVMGSVCRCWGGGVGIYIVIHGSKCELYNNTVPQDVIAMYFLFGLESISVIYQQQYIFYFAATKVNMYEYSFHVSSLPGRNLNVRIINMNIYVYVVSNTEQLQIKTALSPRRVWTNWFVCSYRVCQHNHGCCKGFC